jgi:predicted outer membrane protein
MCYEKSPFSREIGRTAPNFFHLNNNPMKHLNEPTPRRNFLTNSVKGTVALSLGLPALATMLQSFTFSEDESGLWLQDGKPVANEAQFRAQLAMPVQMSMMSSQLAVAQASNQYAKQFAEFELNETKAMMSVMKDMGSPAPSMDAKSQAMLDKLKATTGPAFDKAYITAQVQTHEQLRAMTEGYLRNPAPAKTNTMEMHVRHIATLALPTIKEHIALSKRISTELG